MNEELKDRISPSQWALVTLIIAVAAGSFLYRLLVVQRLEQTAAMFIGLPAFLAILLALSPKAKSPLGMIMKGMTIFLLMSGPLLGEGFICILMAAPLFYFVGFFLGLIANRFGEGAKTYALAVPFLLFSLEGTSDPLSLPRETVVSGRAQAVLSPGQVAARLAMTPDFTGPLPVYLRMGFPRPVDVNGAGLKPGSPRIIHFAGGEGRPGTLVWRVAESGAGFVRFRAESDSSHIAHWLVWREAVIRWNEAPGGGTAIEWTISYRRLLDPAWYFAPWERYAVSLAGQYYAESLWKP